jgi:TRAP transporter 4TM/12TM fusion protein
MATPSTGAIDAIDDTLVALRAHLFPIEQRKPDAAAAVVVTAACVALALITLYFAFTVTIGEVRTRSLHLFFAIPLALVLYPAWRGARAHLDWPLAALAASSFAWAFYRADAWLDRFVGYDDVPTLDFVFGIIALVMIFEATRRTVGVAIVVLNVAFIAYALTGPSWPGVLEHGGWAPRELVEMLYMDAEGIFNFVTGIMATYLFTFLLFGVFLRATGGDTVFIDIASSVAGHRQGGPAKVAVVSSAFMGMLSGSSISNVTTTGTMTIPMMKRLGFRDYEAAAIETVASVGGGLMPPLMGTGVFIMASITNIPLIDILLYSIAPGILYFTALYFYADIRAAQRQVAVTPKRDLPDLYRVLAAGGHIFVPVIALIGLLLMQFTPFFASAACVVMTVAVSYLRKSTRLHPRKWIVALEGGTRVALTLSGLLASAAIIYGVTVNTGLLTKVTSILLDYSGGSAVLGILLIGAMSYVIGMGLPVTASYVIIAALGAPALQELGVSMLAAHLIIFWFAQDSTITPPICMTAFVAARIAEAEPMRTGWECIRIAKALYIIPFMFAFGSLLDPSLIEVAFDFLAALLMFTMLPAASLGYWRRPLGAPTRILLGAAAVSLFMATVGPATNGLTWLVVSAVLALAVAAETKLAQRRQDAKAQSLLS